MLPPHKGQVRPFCGTDGGTHSLFRRNSEGPRRSPRLFCALVPSLFTIKQEGNNQNEPETTDPPPFGAGIPQQLSPGGHGLGGAAGRAGLLPGGDRPCGGLFPYREPVRRDPLGDAGRPAGPEKDPGRLPGALRPGGGGHDDLPGHGGAVPGHGPDRRELQPDLRHPGGADLRLSHPGGGGGGLSPPVLRPERGLPRGRGWR